ncbi:putative Ig domain-containing protein [Amycolatopsis sp. VS8301801F10]|uniref:putative Ig domain-containing protein n=1 Tax=Amycolatopsis sp. VS8301801F10 TaxID=2652442 RepID=UPI0038FC8298
MMRAGMTLRRLAAAGAALALGAGVAALSAPGAGASPQLSPASCASAPAGYAKCQAVQLVSAGARPASAMSPADLQKAYGVAGMKSGGTTVAIVDAFDDPGIEKDLNDYRSHWNLGSCTKANGCLTVVGQDGTSTLPSKTDSGWATEMAIDVDAVSALCPDCKILLVEANTNEDSDLAAAVDSAVRLGAKIVSNSYADHESAIPSDAEQHYNHPGVAVLAATGDWGSESGSQAEYPATSPEVVAVGGTTLTASGGGYSETAWSKAGSGCSSKFGKPAFQNGISTACDNRATSDISADADPNTGITIYVNGQQSQYGGTSLATPIVAGIWALAGTPKDGDNAATYPYAHTGDFNDVTSGSNGNCGTVICNAGTGWDGPTGLGTPHGVAGLTPGGGTNGKLSVSNPGNQNSVVGKAVSLKVTASGGTSPYTYKADGLPAGLAIDSKSGSITGTPSAAGTSNVTVTATDSAGATAQAPFTWTVTTAPAGKLTAKFTTDYDYGFGAFAHFTLTNGGTSAANGWTLSFDLASNESLSNTNPGTASGSTGHVVITGQDTIPVGGSLTVSQIYQVSGGAFTAPANVSVS